MKKSTFIYTIVKLPKKKERKKKTMAKLTADFSIATMEARRR